MGFATRPYCESHVWDTSEDLRVPANRGVKMKKVGRKFGGFARKRYLCTRKSR